MIHPTADVSPQARIGSGCRIWHQVQVREDTEIGENCVLAKGVYVGEHAQVGNNVKVQAASQIGAGTTIEDGVFLGPNVILNNDLHPRAINPDGSLKTAGDWTPAPVTIRYGASLSGSVTVIPGVTIGRWALVGAGAVVTRDVPDYALVVGNPARQTGYVCPSAHRLHKEGREGSETWVCPQCGWQLPASNQ